MPDEQKLLIIDDDVNLRSQMKGALSPEYQVLLAADLRRPGQIELTQGGTLFLDEIGELSAALQVKLPQFLQESTIQRVGECEEIEVDARILAATNVDLEEAIKLDPPACYDAEEAREARRRGPKSMNRWPDWWEQ